MVYYLALTRFEQKEKSNKEMGYSIGISNRTLANWWKDKYLTTHLVKGETGLERYPEKNIQSVNWIDVDI